jgi:iron complex transport system substrate-binding protein
MIEAAGGEPVLAVGGERSIRMTWEQIAAEAIDVTVFAPCGFDLEGSVAQAESFLGRPEASGLGHIYAVDANAYFSRPGPRVVDGVELLSRLLHRDALGAPPAYGAFELRARG